MSFKYLSQTAELCWPQLSEVLWLLLISLVAVEVIVVVRRSLILLLFLTLNEERVFHWQAAVPKHTNQVYVLELTNEMISGRFLSVTLASFTCLPTIQ